MKYLRRYSTLNDYIQDFLTLRNLSTHLSLIDDTDNMLGSDEQKKTVFMKSTGSIAWVGDLLAWDTQKSEWCIIHRDNIGTLNDDNTECTCGFDMDRYIPDAVCVIPACHMKDTKARYCALRDCYDEKYRCSSFEDTNYNNIVRAYYFWSEKHVDVTTLNYYYAIQTVESGNNGSNYQTNVSGSWLCNYSYIQIPSEKGDIDKINMGRAMSKYYSALNPRTYKDIDETNILIDVYSKYNKIGPWLYNDGTYEEENSYGIKKYKEAFTQYCNEDDKHLNVLSDLDGYENTKTIIDYCEANNRVCQAAYAAYTYEQNELSNGQWYLPASGELAYLLCRWYIIQLSLYKLYLIADKPSAWPAIIPLYCGNNYWSSNQVSTNYVVDMGTNDGALQACHPKSFIAHVRPYRAF